MYSDRVHDLVEVMSGAGLAVMQVKGRGKWVKFDIG